MKFGRLMQNEMPVINRSVSKPALEFQYGRCLSNVSAVDRDISLKFGRPMQNDTHDEKKVKIETGSRIPIRQPSVS